MMQLGINRPSPPNVMVVNSQESNKHREAILEKPVGAMQYATRSAKKRCLEKFGGNLVQDFDVGNAPL